MIHWLAHILGIDTQQSEFYDAWSGCIPALIGAVSAASVVWAVLRSLNCHQHRCWRLGKHPVAGTGWKTCRRHHPDPRVAGGLQAHHIEAAHREGG